MSGSGRTGAPEFESVAPWPIAIEDVRRAAGRLAPYLSPTPARHYPLLDEWIGGGTSLLAKHENHQPTCSFKVRNGLSFATALSAEERKRGIVAASTGNHGQGVAYAAHLLGAKATVCVPAGNNPEKNAAMRAWGAEVIEAGKDYDDALEAMLRLSNERGYVPAHSTNDVNVLAGAATLSLELLEQAGTRGLDAIVVAVGGGSQCVGALTVARALAPHVAVYGVQAAGAPAIHDSWHAREPRTGGAVATFAEGVATRRPYALTFSTLREGLADFVTVSESEIAEAIRVVLKRTHNLLEGAGALGVAGAYKLRERLRGKRVGVVFSGANIDTNVLERVLALEI